MIFTFEFDCNSKKHKKNADKMADIVFYSDSNSEVKSQF